MAAEGWREEKHPRLLGYDVCILVRPDWDAVLFCPLCIWRWLLVGRYQSQVQLRRNGSIILRIERKHAGYQSRRADRLRGRMAAVSYIKIGLYLATTSYQQYLLRGMADCWTKVQSLFLRKASPPPPQPPQRSTCDVCDRI